MISLLAQLAPGIAAPGAPPPAPTAALPPETAAGIRDLVSQVETLSVKAKELAGVAGLNKPEITRLDVFHGYMGVFVVAFLIALLATPVMRRLAITHGIVDRPKESRKIHRQPIAYLGGVAVYLGILAGVFFAYTTPFHHLVELHPSVVRHDELQYIFPFSVLGGMTLIMLCGLMDDVMGIFPRAKIAGMLFASAALAASDVGVKVAAGFVVPVAKALGTPITTSGAIETIAFQIPLPMSIGGYSTITIDLIYWIGTAVIALFVLGACNASNLIDGLDGLLAGTTAIANIGLLIIALGLAVVDDGPRDASRIILCMAVVGACLGFLPHNFNPANIFLGDTGSLLLGFCTIVVVLMLGDTGKTHLVLAGLVIYSIPIIDTTLAIVRRKITGRKISDADDQHLHHMLKRALGVKGAVFALYGIGASFAVIGVLMSEGRQRVIYALAMLVAAFIGVTAFKIARKTHIEAHMAAAEADRERRAAGTAPPQSPSQSPSLPRPAMSSSEPPAKRAEA